MEPSEKQFFRKVAFGERLAQARTRLKLSQEALAEAVGTTARSISRWEHNQAIPQQYYRERLCEVLQTTAEALFGANDEKQQGVEKQAPIWHVPYPRNPYFTGREDILYQLHERLHQEHQIALTQPQIMSGLGGIGKTQTALEYLYRFRDDYQTVLWVGAETPEILISDYRILAHLFQLPEKDSPDQILLREAIKRWFHSHANWLLVFDNVEDMDQLHIMLPDAYQGHILITTRSQIVGTLGLHIDLQKMEPAEGALFLLRRAKLLPSDAALEDAPPSLFAQANTLVELLDGLPLALDQAGAYIEETACSLSDYLERYATRRTVLLSTRGTLSNHHPDSVTTTLSLTVEQVERSSPIAADLLRVCAFLYAEAIPEEFFIRTGEALSMQLQSISDDPFLLDEAIRKLRRFSLLHREAETKTLSIHRLLQAIIRDRMTRDECRQRINRIIEAMLQIFPSYDNSVYGGIQQRLQRYFSHALMCATHIEQCDITSVKAEELLYRVAQYLQLWGENAQSLLLLKQVINLAKKIYETEQMKVAFYLNALAYVYIDASQYKLAEQCFQQALNVCDNTNQSDLLITANSLLGLASIFCKTGKYGQAQSLAQRALQIKESILGSNHYAIAQILNILGICYRNQEKYTESEILLQRSINIYKETLEEEHFLLASCLRNLGSLYDLQRDYIQASTFYQQALQIYKKRMGKGHILIGTTANKLGNSYFAQKLYQKAEMFFREALMIFERLPEPHYFHTAYVLTDLGELYLVQGHSHLAKSCIERALTIFGETIQISRVGYQEIVYCLLLAGNNLTKRDDLTEARTYYQRGWTIGKQKIGPDHPLTMHCRDRLETQSILRNE